MSEETPEGLNTTYTPGEVASLAKSDYSKFLPRLTEENGYDVSSYVDVIANRFISETIPTTKKPSIDTIDSDFIGQYTRIFFWRLTHLPDIQIAPPILEKLYSCIDSSNSLLAHHATELFPHLVRLDYHAKDTPKFLNLRAKYKEDLAYKLTHYTTREQTKSPDYDPDKDVARYNLQTATMMVESVFGELPNDFPEILIRALNQTDHPRVIATVLNLIGNRVGYNELRKILRHQVKKDPSFEEKYRLVDQIIWQSSHDSTSKLEDIYESIPFEDYEPNQELNTFELQLLDGEIANLHVDNGMPPKILDLGAGTGRLMLPLLDAEQDVTGFDLVQKHIDYIKEKNPNAKVLQGDWEDTFDENWNPKKVVLPFDEKSYDLIYCLGRSASHNITEKDWVNFLDKINNVLTDEGEVILDTAETLLGDYKSELKKHLSATQRLAITHTSDASLNDGPDSIHSFDRLMPSQNQFHAMACLAGFDARIIATHEYSAKEDGNFNLNLYWKLKKRKIPLSTTEMEEYANQAFTSRPPLFAFVI